MFNPKKIYTPEELEKIREERKKQAIFAGYYRPKYNEAVRRNARRTKR